MKTKLQVFALLISGAVSTGCSAGNVPSVSDVEPTIRGFFDACTYKGKPQFKVTDFKK